MFKKNKKDLILGFCFISFIIIFLNFDFKRKANFDLKILKNSELKNILIDCERIIKFQKKRKIKIDIKNVLKICLEVNDFYKKFNFEKLDKYDIYALFLVEVPSLDNNVRGKFGEIGIGQLKPETIKFIQQRYKKLDPYRLADNIEMSLFYLKQKITWLNNYELGIIAYNGLSFINKKINKNYLKKIRKVKSELLDY